MYYFFSKTTPTRNRIFQITTKMMVADDGNRYVEKVNTYREGVSNIKRIAALSPKIKEAFGEYYDVVKLIDGRLISPYYEDCISLEKKLCDAIDANDTNLIHSIFELWVKIIVGSNNKTDFDATNKFQEIFGGCGDKLKGSPATRLSNLDCSAENILLLNDTNEIKVIDYEWTFGFCIPIDFIKYYNLKLFCKKYYDKRVFDNLVHIWGVNIENQSVYEKFIQNFYDYISIDENGIDYRSMGNSFLKPSYKDSLFNGRYKYRFPVDVLPKGCRVVVYGGGDVGRDYMNYIQETGEYELIACLDKRYSDLNKQNSKIIAPEMVRELEFDFVVLAVCNRGVANDMKHVLKRYGIKETMIFWDEDTLI